MTMREHSEGHTLAIQILLFQRSSLPFVILNGAQRSEESLLPTIARYNFSWQTAEDRGENEKRHGKREQKLPLF